MNADSATQFQVAVEGLSCTDLQVSTGPMSHCALTNTQKLGQTILSTRHPDGFLDCGMWCQLSVLDLIYIILFHYHLSCKPFWNVLSVYSRWMDLSDRMKAARRVRGYSQQELAKRCGLKQSSVAHIESGRNQNSKYLPQLASTLEVSYQWLLSGKGDMDERSKPSVGSAIELIQLRSLSDFDVDTPMNNAAPQWLPAPKDIPVDCFAVTVEGDSMVGPSRSYAPGSIIFVNPNLPESIHGKRVIALVDGFATFREYKHDSGQFYLMPLNPQYPARQIAADTKILGVVVGSYLAE